MDDRQSKNDRPKLLRHEVARRAKRDVSWVRRREGKDLHPVFDDGAHRFEVFALGRAWRRGVAEDKPGGAKRILRGERDQADREDGQNCLPGGQDRSFYG